MLRILCAASIVAAAFTSGCSSNKPATVKGSLSYEGQPFALPSEAREIFIVFHGIGADGLIDQFKMYTAAVKDDGTFELTSSGGELPLGLYQWSITGTKIAEQFKPFALDKSKARIEFKPGPNRVVLDLSQK